MFSAESLDDIIFAERGSENISVRNRRQICLWETLAKILDEHLNSLRFMCIELSASSENAFE